jgi:23S rRNA (guanosine2251-2'-O)-methyltransferase
MGITSMARKRWQPRSRSRRDHRKRPSARTRFRTAADPHGPALLFGWHTVKAALENPARRFRRLLATENALRRLADDGVPLPLKPELPVPSIDELEPGGVVLVLDQITDPHNVGAILRSAAAFAVKAIVTTARHSPEATGVLAKSASGALELVPLVLVQNLARGIEGLHARGFLLIGLDSTGQTDLADLTLRTPLALVLGAEGRGLRQLTRSNCDHLARIDLPGEIKSLNVSNAAALGLYVVSRHLRDV